MKRRFFRIMAALMLLAAMAVSASAAELEIDGHVTDQAELLTYQELDALEEKAQRISRNYQCGVYIITVEDMADLGFYSAWDAAVNLRIENGLGYGQGQDTMLLFLSMEDRDYATVVYGDWAHQVFSDDALQLMEEEFLPPLGKNQYAEGFDKYLDFCDYCLRQAKEGKPVTRPVNVPFLLLVSGGVSGALSLLVCAILCMGMKSVTRQRAADNYVTAGGAVITGRSDVFTHRTVRRERIPDNNGGGGRSRSHSSSGHSGRSGKF